MPKIVVIAVKHPTEPNLYLHGLRRDNNKWAAPGGHAIEGEADLESARRELEEETGLRGVQLDKIANQKFGDNDVHLYTCAYPENATLNSDADPDAEFLTFKWLDPTAHNNLHVPSRNNLLSIWMRSQMQKDEGVNLIHFSPTKGLKEISPAKMGTSGVGGAQYKRGLPEHKTSFFYTENSLPEDLVTQGAMSKYIVKAPANVYDLDTDPHGFKKEARARNNGAWNEDVLHSLLKEKGYNGLSWEMRPGTTVTQLYHAHPVHEEMNLKAELTKTAINRKTGVQSVGNTIPLNRLQQIKQDNFVGAGGKDYDQHEVNQAIMHRKIVQAKKMKLFKKPESPKTHGTFEEMAPPLMPVRMAKDEFHLKNSDKSKAWCDMQLNKNITADEESENIKENKKKPENQQPHKFKAAVWTHPNGHPRCIKCGDEERTGGMCEPTVKKSRSSVTVEPFSADPKWFDPKKHDFVVKVHRDGQQVGMMAVTHKPQGIMPYQFNVHQDFRRLGLGTKIAQHAEKISNKKIMATPDMTPAATAWLKSYQQPPVKKKP